MQEAPTGRPGRDDAPEHNLPDDLDDLPDTLDEDPSPLPPPGASAEGSLASHTDTEQVCLFHMGKLLYAVREDDL